jgi:uncharacterized protein (TIGR00725 family)
LGLNLYVAVIGSGEASLREAETAEEVGRLLAREGAVVVCGGLGGVMHAAARGCTAEGGTSIGILPGDDRGPASPFLTVAISTGIGEARNALVVRTADAVVAVGGGFGTLSEIGLARAMDKPVVGLDTWTFQRSEIEDSVIEARGPADAVARAIDAARSAREFPWHSSA